MIVWLYVILLKFKMVFIGTRLATIDNSGALELQIIKVLRSKRQHPTIGNIVVVTVKSARATKKLKVHEIKKGVLVQTKRPIIRKRTGITVSFDQNSLVILGKGLNPLGTRLKGTVTQELRRYNYMKILSMAPSVV